VADASRAIGCDPSYVALPLLSALAAAIGNTRRIELKGGWCEPAIIWVAIVGESGTLKTPAFKLVVDPIRIRQGQSLKRHAEEMDQYEAEVLRYDKRLSEWKRKKDTSDDPPTKPKPPLAERFIVTDTTVEALAPILLPNPRGLLLARDELAGWVGSFDRYTAGRGGADAANWLSMHNGESVVVDRKSGQPRTIYVPRASVSVIGGIQPSILDQVMGREHRESGLLARLLLAMPPRRPKRWSEAEISPAMEAAIAAVFDRLYELHFDHTPDGDPRPVKVPLLPEGKAVWIEFYNDHAAEQVELTGDLSAAWSKLEGYAARLALVMHFVRWAANDPTLCDPDAVDDASIAAGVTLSRWFGHEARRVYGILAESDEERDERQLVELIRRKGGTVTPRDLMRASRRFASAADAEAALNELGKLGLGAWKIEPPGPQGGKPSRRFALADVDDSPPEDRSRGTPVDDTPGGEAENPVLSTVSSVNACGEDWGEL